MLRTIFFPLVRRGAPRLASLLFVFFISAVMHELAVGVPLRMLRGWAFWGMMLQVRAEMGAYSALLTCTRKCWTDLNLPAPCRTAHRFPVSIHYGLGNSLMPAKCGARFLRFSAFWC